VTDTRSDADVGRAIFAEALRRGADAAWCQVQARDSNGAELPEPIVAALASCDLAALVTSWSATHSPGVIAAVQAGTRVLSMPGVRSSMLNEGALTADYKRVRELTERWGEYFARGSRVRLTTHAGTDLTADLGGWSRPPFLDDGTMPRGIGMVGNMPAGEIAVAPVEGSAHGRVIADLTMSTTPRPVSGPVTIDVENGKVTAVRGGPEADDFEAALSAHGDSSRVVAEIALGTNPGALHIGVVIEDEKRLGTAHVGFGHSIGLGGLNVSTIHADAIFASVTMTVDGVELIRDGVPVAEAIAREPLSMFPGAGGRYRAGGVPGEIVDGRLHAAWLDVRGRRRLAQVGDDEAAGMAAGVLTAERWAAAAGSPEARVLELMQRYGLAVREPAP
jgi:leucyl aminopeptidase (aminopeptidase T)